MPKKKGPAKAYEDKKFINSADGRILRILAEFLQPNVKFKKHKIVDTIVFFGSARLIPREVAVKRLNKLKKINPKSKKNFAEELRTAQHFLKMSKYYEDAVELSRRLTEWSLSLPTHANRFTLCTGGGPGIMEAANKGAKIAGGYSIGLNIGIPHEQYVNKYVTPDLSFEFHYFFMRKFWLAYLAKCLIVFPGGFGTMDEFFEVLTLMQTQKIKKKMLLLVYDEKYWKSMVNFDGLVRNEVISEEDMSLFNFCNSVDEAFSVIKNFFEKHYMNEKEVKRKEPKVDLK